jgi:hypothetical protein
MGFKKIYISKYHRNLTTKNPSIEIVTVGKIEMLVKLLFG